MSKAIKQMQMDVLKDTFKGVRDLVVLNVVGLDAVTDNNLRIGLRKKGIRLQVVKNTLARKVLGESGLEIKNAWEGATTLAWGGNSIADLSKELEPIVKKNEKFIKVKTAVADGEEITFEQALKMPTREEAIGRVVALMLGAGSRLVGAIVGPGGQLAGAVKSLADKTDDAAPAEAAPSTEAAPA